MSAHDERPAEKAEDLATEQVASPAAAVERPLETGPERRVEQGRPEPVMDTGPERSTRVRRGALLQGTRVGRYLLLKPLGQGGMGAVYAAYDPELERKVALKLLLPGGKDLSRSAARLQREAQAMARLSHPNVCQVYDTGTLGAQVYVVMEYVDGTTLQEWMQQEHPWQEVLRVFLQAGQGLAAAHAQGLVHRDFKPANVLLSKSGRVYVTDFGLARLVAAPGDTPEGGPAQSEELPTGDSGLLNELLTQAGLVVGTPAYMPPEQYVESLEPDARSDQFSFCAALYRTLFKQRPFEWKRMAEVATSRSLTGLMAMPAALSEPPGSRSGVALAPATGSLIHPPPKDARVPAWLKQVVMKGLSLEPAQRFASMQELLRVLSQERRAVRQRQVLTATGVMVVGLAAVGAVAYQRSQVCGGAGQQVARVWGPEQQKKLEESFKASGNPSAEQVARTVVGALDEYARGWTQQSVQACEATRLSGVQTEELLGLRTVCLERRLKDMGALVRVLGEADGKVVDKAVDAAAALPALEACADVEQLATQQALPSDPARRAEVERLGGEVAEVKALLDAGRVAQGLERVEKLEQPVRQSAWRPLLAELRLYQGWLLLRGGQFEDAALQLRQAVQEAEAGRADRLKLEALTRLLSAQGQAEQRELASYSSTLAEATLTRLGGESLPAAELALSLGNLAVVQERSEQARTWYQRALELMDQAGLPPQHPKRMKATYGLGRAAYVLGEVERAQSVLEQALAQAQALLGPRHPDVGRAHYMLSIVLRHQGQAAPSVQQAQTAVDIFRLNDGPQQLMVIDMLNNLSDCLREAGQFEQALQASQESLGLAQKSLPEDDELMCYSHAVLGQALLALGRSAEALVHLEKAVAGPIVESVPRAEYGFALAQALWQTGGDRQRALAEAERALKVLRAANQARLVSRVETWLQFARDEGSRQDKAPPKKSGARRTRR